MRDLPSVSVNEVNFNRRFLVCICIDCSGSMAPYESELVEAIERLISDLKSDSIAAKSAEIGIVGFGNDRATILRDFATVREFSSSPRIECEGSTPLGMALDTSLTLMREKQEELTRQGIPQFKPLMIVLSDGAPTGEWSAPARRFTKEAEKCGWNTISLAYGEADERVLGTFTNTVLKATKGFSFAEFFKWLSSSVASVSRSSEGDKVALELPPGVVQLQL